MISQFHPSVRVPPERSSEASGNPFGRRRDLESRPERGLLYREGCGQDWRRFGEDSVGQVRQQEHAKLFSPILATVRVWVALAVAVAAVGCGSDPSGPGFE